MESMKDLVIQALESKGVLGQIRASLRSAVFKIVDEQDQQNKLGCGLKWENPLLYKIIDTRVGQLLSEIIREFMEFFRMDYSLSIFIPECGISPERLKKEEILGKLGVREENYDPFQKMQLPLLYYIIYYFLENLKNRPDEVLETINKVQNDVEKSCDDIIDANLKVFAEENYKQADDIPPSDQSPREEVKQSSLTPESTSPKAKEANPAKKKESVIDENADDLPNKRGGSSGNIDKNKKKRDNSDEDGEVFEDIKEEIVQEEDYEKSNDKKNSSSNNTQTISISGGNDYSVDSHKLEKCNYVENVDKVNNK